MRRNYRQNKGLLKIETELLWIHIGGVMLKDKIKAENLNLYYGEHHALKDVSMTMKEQAITALIGLSGCGK